MSEVVSAQNGREEERKSYGDFKFCGNNLDNHANFTRKKKFKDNDLGVLDNFTGKISAGMIN
jgi:hypothetical protein